MMGPRSISCLRLPLLALGTKDRVCRSSRPLLHLFKVLNFHPIMVLPTLNRRLRRLECLLRNLLRFPLNKGMVKVRDKAKVRIKVKGPDPPPANRHLTSMNSLCIRLRKDKDNRLRDRVPRRGLPLRTQIQVLKVDRLLGDLRSRRCSVRLWDKI